MHFITHTWHQFPLTEVTAVSLPPQGLTIETCGGGLYEELSVYAQPEGAEAPWE